MWKNLFWKFRILACVFLTFFIFLSGGAKLTAKAGKRLQDPGEKLVVVIDPGHGGENHGTTENGYLEKSMNMTTAMAMYDELCRFEGIEVYMTHTDDRDLSLKDRAKYAAEKEADLLISLHYNASETHLLYGSEAWISLEPEYHAYGYQFATVAMRELRDMGMNLRGIKTKPNSRGEDYYGVIREAVALGIPAVILEHCHVDHPEDSLHCDTEEEKKAFGVADAHAVAKYYGLKSSSLGVDYSDYPDTLPDISLTESVVRAGYDASAPDSCTATVSEAFYDEDRVLVKVSAFDKESNLIYYSFSLDGGDTFSKIMPWPEGDILTGEFENSFLMELEIPDGTSPKICFRAYNPYDVYTDSNVLTFPQEFRRPESAPEEISGETQDLESASDFTSDSDAVPAGGSDTREKKQAVEVFLSVLEVCIPMVFAVFLLLLGIYLVKKNTENGRDRTGRKKGSE